MKATLSPTQFIFQYRIRGLIGNIRASCVSHALKESKINWVQRTAGKGKSLEFCRVLVNAVDDSEVSLRCLDLNDANIQRLKSSLTTAKGLHADYINLQLQALESFRDLR